MGGRKWGLYLQPHPQASALQRPPFPPQPLTCSCSQLSRYDRRLRPRRFRSALVLLTQTPTADFCTAAPPAPLPGSLLSSLHLAAEAATATGAVLRTPTRRPGYFPPPRSRESCAAASGSCREIHHHGSDCCRGIRVPELKPGRGAVVGAGGRRWRRRQPGYRDEAVGLSSESGV